MTSSQTLISDHDRIGKEMIKADQDGQDVQDDHDDQAEQDYQDDCDDQRWSTFITLINGGLIMAENREEPEARGRDGDTPDQDKPTSYLLPPPLNLANM